MRVSTRPAGALVYIGLCALSGCNDSERTWAAKAESPDGTYVARAQTHEYGGWGTGSAPQTMVDLNWTKGHQRPVNVFTFIPDVEEQDAMHVGMEWLTPTHLELTYKGHPIIEFQAIRFQGVDISIRELDGAADR
jgi:hypothetical protein